MLLLIYFNRAWIVSRTSVIIFSLFGNYIETELIYERQCDAHIKAANWFDRAKVEAIHNDKRGTHAKAESEISQIKLSKKKTNTLQEY